MQKRTTLLTVALLATLASTALAKVEVYEIDPVHSSIGFKIRHFFSQVPGTFSDFSGAITYDTENPENSKAEAVIRVKSVDTNNRKRDDHLRNDDFFNEPVHPEMTFTSTKWVKTGESTYTVHGNLTIMEVTKEVALDVAFLGSGPHPRREGTFLSGWSATTTLDRTEFGMGGYQAVLGNEVAIEINIEAARKDG